MRKKLIAFIMTLIMVCTVISPANYVKAESACAILYSDGTLILQQGSEEEAGHGSVLSRYTNVETGYFAPWSDSASKIKQVYVRDPVTPKNISGWFKNCNNLISADLNNLKVAKLYDASAMFQNCYNLKEVRLNEWSTYRFQNLSYMFDHCYKLQNLDLSNWNTAIVTDMAAMFRDCREIKSLDLSHFQTRRVENMTEIFAGMKSLQSLNIASFSISSFNHTSYIVENLPALNEITVNENISAQKVQGQWYTSQGKQWDPQALYSGIFTVYKVNPLLKEYSNKKIAIHVKTTVDGKYKAKWSNPDCGSTFYPWKLYNQDGEDVTYLSNLQYVYAKGEQTFTEVYLKEGDTYTLSREFAFQQGYLGQLSGNTTFTVTEDSQITLQLKIDYFSSSTISVNKIWDDQGNEDVRPKEINVMLYKNGQLYDQQILNSENQWHYAWTGLPTYEVDEDGSLHEIKWTVQEKIPVGYAESDSQLLIQSDQKVILYKDLEVYKYWKDNNDYNLRGKITLHLWELVGQERREIDQRSFDCRQEYKTEMPLTVWKNLPVTDLQGNKIQYEITEDAGEGYESSIILQETDRSIINKITNTLSSHQGSQNQTKDILITKIWEDNDNPTYRGLCTYTLYDLRNSEEVLSKSVLPTQSCADNKQTFVIKDVPLYDTNGLERIYSIRETYLPNGYMSMSSSDGINYIACSSSWDSTIGQNYVAATNLNDASTGKSAYYFKNYRPESHRVLLVKRWNEENQTQTHPDELHFTFLANLYHDDVLVKENAVVQEVDWTNIAHADYNQSEAAASTDFTPGKFFYYDQYNYMTNGYAIILVNLPNAYYYEGKWCDLVYNGIMESNADGYIMSRCEMKRQYNYGQLYGMTNSSNPNYQMIQWELNVGSSYGSNQFMIDNSPGNKKVVKVKKEWNCDPEYANPVKVRLMKKNKYEYIDVTGEDIVLNAENNWSYEWNDLPLEEGGTASLNKDGSINVTKKEISYRVFEVDDQGKVIVLNNNEETGAYDCGGILCSVRYSETENTINGVSEYQQSIRNTPVIKIPWEKKWEDCNNADRSRVSARIRLQYKIQDQSVDVAEKKVYYDTKNYFIAPKYDENGQEREYQLMEDEIPGYSSEITGDMTEGFLVINRHTPENLSFMIMKEWDDGEDEDEIRPDSICAELYQNGEIIRSYILSEENDWKTAVEVPSVDQNGQPVKYEVKEKEVAKYYSASVSGNAFTNFYIRNRHVPGCWNTVWNISNKPKTETITVTKEWEVSEDYDYRDTSVYVQLYRKTDRQTSPVPVGRVIELNQENHWTYSWENRAVYDQEEKIIYTIEETDAEGRVFCPQGMTCTISQKAENEFTIRNKTTKLLISKVDEKNALLAGAHLQIWKKNSTAKDIVIEWDSSEEKATSIEGILEAGETYILHESKAPKGFAVSQDVSFTVPSDGSSKSVIMSDEKLKVLPQTGGLQSHKMLIHSFLFSAVLAIITLKKRKESRKNL